jgi:UDP-N-acetylmuramate dehydrogenase
LSSFLFIFELHFKVETAKKTLSIFMLPPVILQSVSLKNYNTFGIDVLANYFVEINDEKQLLFLLQTPEWKPIHKLVLGGGSNILFTKHFDGLVLKNNFSGFQVVKENPDFVWLQVGAGETWHHVVLYAIAKGWGGIENLALIYGTAGAAPMQNIGAYGVEIKETFDSLEAIEIATGKKLVFDKESCRFGYRQSIFKEELKHQVIITSITLKLTKRNHQLNTSYGAILQVLETNNQKITLQNIARAVVQIRQSKLPNPTAIGNAGSFFKNPEIKRTTFEALKAEYPTMPFFATANPEEVKIPAGWLIEQTGWKGKRQGNIGVHKDQALVLVNYGGGTGRQIWELALQIKAEVKQKFGILLHNEVNLY